ncbi:MAG: O-antigen ligase family protein [Patescibacteria group bacterium]
MKFFLNLPKNFDDYLALFIKIGLALILFLPLIIGDHFYFPYIVPRNLYWRLLVDLIFAVYMFLAIKNKAWRPKFNWGFVLLLGLVLSLTISSLLGSNFGFSFWSSFVRMDGLVSWYHILLYVVVLLGTLKKKEDWLLYFNISVLAAWLVAIYSLMQWLNLDWSFIASSDGGPRLTGTFGNASFLASFFFLQIVIAAYLLLNNLKYKAVGYWHNIFYLVSLFLFIFILLETQTRGDFFSLVLFFILLGVFYLWFERRQKKWFYYLISSLIIALLLFLSLLWWQKDTAWVNNDELLRKISLISLNLDTTVSQSNKVDVAGQTRLFVWQNSLLGFRDKPILGWGVENFSEVFSKYFPRRIYQEASSEIWLDRPHNVLLQYLIEGGVLALGFYLAIFVYLGIILYKKYKSQAAWLFYFFWIAFLISFLFHDLFTFDHLNSNIYFYLILAFLFKISPTRPAGLERDFKINKIILVPLCLLLPGVLIWQTVFLPAKSNQLLLKTIQNVIGANQESDILDALHTWQKSFVLSPSGEKDKVQVLSNLYREILATPRVSEKTREAVFQVTDKYLTAAVEKYPQDIMLATFLSTFYNLANFDHPELIQKDIALLNKMHLFAPQRPDILVRQTNAYLANKDISNAEAAAQKMLAFFPWAKEPWWNLLAVYFQDNNEANMRKCLDAIIAFNAQLPANKRPDTFTAADRDRLQAYLDLARINRQIDQIKLLEEYLNKKYE